MENREELEKTADKYFNSAAKSLTAFKIFCIASLVAAVGLAIYTIVASTTGMIADKNSGSLIGYIVFLSTIIALILAMVACYVTAIIFNKKYRAILIELNSEKQ